MSRPRGARFSNRQDAGRRLASRLTEYANRSDVSVLGLPRGGVPVAAEIAAALKAPLDVFLVRKLGVPGHPELAMGAIAAGGIEVLSASLIAELGISPSAVQQVTARERLELERRDRAFRGDRPPVSVTDRVVIVVDDGLATGSTMEAAVVALRRLGPTAIIVAVPVGATGSVERLRPLADRVVCMTTPEPFGAVGVWYDDFSETTDREVQNLMASRLSVDP